MTRGKPYDWAEQDHCDVIASWGPKELLRRALARRRGTLVEHVGTPPECALCDAPGPCSHARER